MSAEDLQSTRGPRTIDGFALYKIAVVLASEETVSIPSNYSFNVPAAISTEASKRPAET